MFANTLTLTIASVDHTLRRVNQDNHGSEYLYRSDTKQIKMLVRHSTDNVPNIGSVNRHNVYFEQIIFATPESARKLFSVTYTLRDSEGAGPSSSLELSVGAIALLGTLDDGLVVGEN